MGKGNDGDLSIGTGEKKTPCGWANEKELRKREMSEFGVPSPSLFNVWRK